MENFGTFQRSMIFYCALLSKLVVKYTEWMTPVSGSLVNLARVTLRKRGCKIRRPHCGNVTSFVQSTHNSEDLSEKPHLDVVYKVNTKLLTDSYNFEER